MLPLPSDDGHAFDRRNRRTTVSDLELTCRVIQRIADEPRLSGERITVEAQNGVVTLIGTVGSLYARVAAADLARETPGVTDLCNRLDLARAADVTATLERPDAFDQIIVHWNGGTPLATSHRLTRIQCLWTAAAAAMAGTTALSSVLLASRYGITALIVFLPGLLVTVRLILTARRSGTR